MVRIRGVFVTELARMLFSKGCKPDSIPEPLFPGIAITNAIPLRLNFGSSFVFPNYFLRNTALARMAR
jgi:hypothetical protein